MIATFDDNHTEVCLTHGRFLPCRIYKLDEPCEWSSVPGDVARVAAYQNGEREDWR